MADAAEFSPGEMLLGKLRVVRRLGAGGIGAVYEVEHELFVSANVSSFASSQALCCSSSETLTARVMATQLNPSSLTTPTRSTLASHVVSGNPGCGSGESDLGSPQYWTLDRASAGWSSHLGRWVGTWWARSVSSDPYSLRFGTVTPAGVVSADRPVYDVPGSLPRYTDITTYGFSSPRVAVGTTTVLFAWPNDSDQPFPGRYLRWVLYDRDLTSVIAGPIAFGAIPRIDQAAGFANVTNPSIHALTFDGENYILTFNPRQSSASSGSSPDPRIRFLTINEQGAVIGNRPTVSVPTINTTNLGGYTAGLYPSFATVAQGRGFVAAVPNNDNIRFYWGTTSPDAGYLNTEINSGVALNARTDAVVVPLSETRMGLIWSDGDLKRTVMRCGP